MGSGYAGPARILSDQPLAVVVAQEEPSWGASDYNALSSGASSIYLSSLMHAWYDWTSSFTVQNVGSSSSNILIHYVKEDGSTTDKTYPNLAAGDSVVLAQNDPTYGVPAGWHGGARLSSTTGQPLVAIVNQQRVDIHNHQSYSSLLGGGSWNCLYGPFAAYRFASGSYYYNSASDVQNLGTSPTNVTRSYYGLSGGTPVYTTTNIPAEATRSFYVPAEGVASGYGGSLKVTRYPAVPLGGVHNIARLDGGGNPTPGDYGASYNMVQR